VPGRVEGPLADCRVVLRVGDLGVDAEHDRPVVALVQGRRAADRIPVRAEVEGEARVQEVAELVDLVIGLRVPVEQEREGLDIASHGERAYNY